MNAMTQGSDTAAVAWKDAVFAALKAADVRQIHYVPDAGHARAIELAHRDPDIRAVVLTTEEEGVAACAGAWLGGERAALLMQSSGVGNCINMLSLVENCRLPMLLLVTMRGEWAEFNPWQVPMSRATETVLTAMGVRCFRVERPEEVGDVVAAAADLAFGAEQAVAILLGQRLIGRKVWK
ncbi:thiamine pyrophosphate-binding protein [Elioraea rosea]|uniref:thiamine pyrophosphate-binding protein n=1 Tax=Elioraea rosea TaxID=2492390 RepID=UPI001EF743AB|nr:thiamine pyrophosphate-binding protein [Elioraea rosea]